MWADDKLSVPTHTSPHIYREFLSGLLLEFLGIRPTPADLLEGAPLTKEADPATYRDQIRPSIPIQIGWAD